MVYVQVRFVHIPCTLLCGRIDLDARIDGSLSSTNGQGTFSGLHLDLHTIGNILRARRDLLVGSLPLINSRGIDHHRALADVVASEQASCYYSHGFGLANSQRLIGSHRLKDIMVNNIIKVFTKAHDGKQTEEL